MLSSTVIMFATPQNTAFENIFSGEIRCPGDRKRKQETKDTAHNLIQNIFYLNKKTYNILLTQLFSMISHCKSLTKIY